MSEHSNSAYLGAPEGDGYLNIYRRQFAAPCPNDGVLIQYDWELRTQDIIATERILAQTQGLGPMYQEDLADRLYAAFGGFQMLYGGHNGVIIETIREPVIGEDPE